jgi:hypothetical protein
MSDRKLTGIRGGRLAACSSTAGQAVELEITSEPFDGEAAAALTTAQRWELHSRYGNDGSGGEPEPDEFIDGGCFERELTA